MDEEESSPSITRAHEEKPEDSRKKGNRREGNDDGASRLNEPGASFNSTEGQNTPREGWSNRPPPPQLTLDGTRRRKRPGKPGTLPANSAESHSLPPPSTPSFSFSLFSSRRKVISRNSSLPRRRSYCTSPHCSTFSRKQRPTEQTKLHRDFRPPGSPCTGPPGQLFLKEMIQTVGS